jgi:methyltransferase (TIGR00027 family)
VTAGISAAFGRNGNIGDDDPVSNDDDAVASTALLVAAIRAKESQREDRLFDDPLAAKLAGAAGRQRLDAATAAAGEQPTVQIVVRTRFWDEALLEATRHVTQVVILAAGMDSRAYRLAWPDGTDVYEIDQPELMATKNGLLAGDQPTCHRAPIGINLMDDWPSAAQSAGVDPMIPTVWMMEGLLQYLDESAVDGLFDRVDALSAPSSVLLYDIVGKALLESLSMHTVRSTMSEQGSPWLFATDAPAELAERRGWSASVTDVAVPGNTWGRWHAPAIPMTVPGVPRGYFVQAVKR